MLRVSNNAMDLTRSGFGVADVPSSVEWHLHQSLGVNVGVRDAECLHMYLSNHNGAYAMRKLWT